ncbi:universal stress protein UspA [Pseudidiomarina aestuarii]|nr:universal stress protein UspA [Pseudidiomarina aestuarii]
MSQVIACIDGSATTVAVCDYSAWAAMQLDAPLLLLHVLDDKRYPAATDLSGNIGLGSREQLLDELAALDEQRAKLALQQGHGMLESAKARALEDGVATVQMRQRHGDLNESLQDLESDTRLVVLGLHGEDSSTNPQLIGSHVETVIRTAHRPLLLTPDTYKQPRSAMIAYDGSATTQKGVQMVAQSPLFKGMPVHVVMVDADTVDNREKLTWAEKLLNSHGHEVVTALRAGEVEPTLHGYQTEQDIDVLVMGAYGHSRLRQFLVGSTTTAMLQTSTRPVLVLR